jgi:hypothetical protein
VEDVGIFMDIRFILRPFGIFYGHLVYFVVIWYIFWQPCWRLISFSFLAAIHGVIVIYFVFLKMSSNE